MQEDAFRMSARADYGYDYVGLSSNPMGDVETKWIAGQVDPDHMNTPLNEPLLLGKKVLVHLTPRHFCVSDRAAQGSAFDLMESDVAFWTEAGPKLYPRSTLAGFSRQLVEALNYSYRPDVESKEWKGQIKEAVSDLLEGGEAEGEVDPEAVKYACKVVDLLPPECLLLPSPDVSGFADKKAVFFEWLLETDGRMLLTVEPDGTVAYVCTFGNARSKNLGAWEDEIVDLMRPCFVKLIDRNKKDLPAWDASRTAPLSPDSLSKEKIR